MTKTLCQNGNPTKLYGFNQFKIPEIDQLGYEKFTAFTRNWVTERESQEASSGLATRTKIQRVERQQGEAGYAG
jgi:hypothetical protein